MEVIFGVLFLAFIGYMLFGVVMIFVDSMKPRRRRNRGYNFNRARNIEYSKARDSFNAIRNSKHSVKYLDKNIEELNVVYFLENSNFEAVKIGVGQIGRPMQLVKSTTSRNVNGTKVGWQILRIAYFEEMKDAYDAESKVLHYWRREMDLPEQLSAKDMGYSQMKLVNKKIWVPTGGHTETVNVNAICKSFTWNLVVNSHGIINEETKYLSSGFEHNNCDHLHVYSEEKYRSAKSKKKSSRTKSNLKSKYSPDELFWSKIHKLEDDPKCWIWNSATSNGYAIGNYQEKLDLIHRVTWTMSIGEIPKKAFLRNECGLRNCVNPEHWRLEISQDYECTNQGCEKKSESVTKPGLCKTCRQREKRKRRKNRQITTQE
jgi:hypothetical protein